MPAFHPSADGSWEKYFTSVSLSFPRGEMRTMKGSCQEVGMSATVIVLPSLRVRQGAGDQGQVWVLPLWAALSLPSHLFLPSLLVLSQPLSLPSSVGQLSRHLSVGMGRDWWEWAGQRSGASMPTARVGQGLGECGLDRGHSVDWTPEPVKVLVLSLWLPETVVPANFLPSGWALVGLGCMFVAGSEGVDGTNYGKGEWRPRRPWQESCFCLQRNLVAGNPWILTPDKARLES